MGIGIIANDKKNELINNEENKYCDSSFEITGNDKNESHTIICNSVKEGSKVLDVGCAQGLIGKYLHKEKQCEVYGIEIDDGARKLAISQNCYAEIFNFDITNPNTNEYKSFFKSYDNFDYIIFSDVLEHTLYPSNVIFEFGKLLKTGGNILISIPNIAHYDVIDGLLNDRFNYSKMGILDNTHLRFFTKYSFAEYIDSANKKNNGFNFDVKNIGRTIIKPSFYDDYKYISNYIKGNEDLIALQNLFELEKQDSNTETNSLNKILLENRPNITKNINDDIEKMIIENNQLLRYKEIYKNVEEKNIELRAKYNQLAREYQKIVNSNSWRALKPIRSLKSINYNLKLISKNKKNSNKSILYILHSWINLNNIKDTMIGGTTLHNIDLLDKNNNNYILTIIDNEYCLVELCNGGKQHIYDLDVTAKTELFDRYDNQFYSMINKLIDDLYIDIVHIEHFRNFPCDLQYISKKSKVILSLHDYFILCPRNFLLDTNNELCNNPISSDCFTCEKFIDMQTRNKAVSNLVNSATIVTAPDRSVIEKVSKYYNIKNSMIIPNGTDLSSFKHFNISTKNQHKEKNIAFVGGIGDNKGVKEIVELIKLNPPNIKYHLFGWGTDEYLNENHKNYIYHGKYKRNELPYLLNKNNIDLVVLLSTCPESFSYILSEVIYSQIPVLSFDIGALGSRIEDNGVGETVKVGAGTDIILRKIDYMFEANNYNKYIKNLKKCSVPTIEEMKTSFAKIYNELYKEEKVKNLFIIQKHLDGYQKIL